MLQNLMNEAAIYAVRSDRDTIAADDVDSALDRLTVGQSKDTGTNRKKRQELVAWHEAGHAVMAALTPGFDPVAKVTIVPRSNGAGTDCGVPWPSCGLMPSTRLVSIRRGRGWSHFRF